ncbi:hypothetical protein HJC23_000062 [Cyclotella cryptica]|uniref:Sulfotransferase n=1 Tax=Cyclotella cryptica TaxID=29204 RepID=A0ABD3PIW9_9STRA
MRSRTMKTRTTQEILITIKKNKTTSTRRGSFYLSRVHLSLIVIALALSSSHLLIQRTHVESMLLSEETSPNLANVIRGEHRLGNRGEVNANRQRHFDCAISWLRLPKTASTSVAQGFIVPLSKAGRFTNTDIGPNTCIETVGGCAPFWKGLNWNKNSISRRFHSNNTRVAFDARHIPPPRYIGSLNSTQINKNQRCFPMKRPNAPRIACHEYDARSSTLNFGPHRRNPANQRQPVQKLPSQLQAHFDFGPMTATHVGLDPSLFGWIMPSHPMVFSTFRDPIERLLSSFHYGIQFGSGRPGEVDKCDLPGAGKGKGRVERWNERVVKAREIATLQHDWTEYQSLLREYLDTCRMAADNAYIQFLDPYSKDVNRAINNLEKYVIVGLQTEMEETMERWINITKKSCRKHPHFDEMNTKVFEKILGDMKIKGGFDRKRETRSDNATFWDNIDFTRFHKL